MAAATSLVIKRNSIVEEDMARIVAHDLPWRVFANKTVLVSGANGFLPAYLVETLLYLNEVDRSMNCRLIGLVRNREKACVRFAHFLDRPDFAMVIQDVTAPAAIPVPVDFIIHAASQASPKYYGIDPVGTLAANSLGTYNLLSFARDCRAEGFLFISSGDVYGQVPESQIPTREDCYGALDPTLVRSCYGESKRMGETMCAAFDHQFGVPTRIVRPTHTYGPGLALDDGRVFADFVANLVRHEDIVLKSDGSARRAFCYLADAALGFFTVLLKGERGQAYNVGNEACEASVAELAQMLVDLFPERGLQLRFENKRPPAGYLQSTASRGSLDTGKLRKLGWRPTVGLEEGFRRTVMSFEEQQ
jgi:nucleoside-diphosphate-sugar epimerase